MTDQLLLLDYVGVLTGDIRTSFRAFEEELGVPPGRSFELLVAAADGADGGGEIGALERGERSLNAFDAHLRSLLADAGHRVPAEGSLVARLFEAVVPTGALWEVVARARRAGITTGLVSNSWGLEMYPRARLDAHFDVQVISGEVGLRKPEPAIFELAAARAGVALRDCVFVDDLPHNVAAARRLGMVGVHHDGDHTRTIRALEEHLGIELGG